jgi:glycosyltransferase involved in cell wall biosynthesis
MSAVLPSGEPLHVAYLINQYPMVSHSFIRREILALERRGVRVQRIALRGWTGPLAGADDVLERERTQHVLAGGAGALIASLARMLLTRPGRALSVLGEALRMARGSDRSLPYHLVYFAEACVAADWIERSGARHLHAHFGTNSAEVAMLAARLASIGFSFTVHGPEEFDRPQAIGLAEKIARSDFVVAISSFGRSQLLRWTAFAQWPKVHVVHCGIDRSYGETGASGEPSTQAPRRLVCVGRICEQKGQLLLLSAMRRVLDRGADFELVLAGDGEMRAEVERLCAELDLASRVRITGWISGDQVRDELLGARALVLPSFAEGLPVVIMEAMALARPVISTYVAGIPELVRAGETGWLVPAGDVDALVDAIEACLRADAATLAAMGEAGRQRVLARHDVDVEAARLAVLFVASSAAHVQGARP